MKIDFDKNADGLVPAVVQDSRTGRVLMLGYMDADAFAATQATGKVTFYSRSKRRLWTKGETSGNFVNVDSIRVDCDSDTLLVLATSTGPVCHSGTDTCFGLKNDEIGFLFDLEKTIADRWENPSENSYTSRMFAEGRDRMAQKVGEEAVELVIASLGDDMESIKSEAADLIYHLLVLLRHKGVELSGVVKTLENRREK